MLGLKINFLDSQKVAEIFGDEFVLAFSQKLNDSNHWEIHGQLQGKKLTTNKHVLHVNFVTSKL